MAIVRRLARTGAVVGLVTSMSTSMVMAQSSFSDAEKASVLQFWTQKAQYNCEPAMHEGQEWVVRMTPAGSVWIREVYKLFQTTKVNPTIDPNGSTPEQQQWAAWIDRQVKRDWMVAEAKARSLNLGESKSVDTNPAVAPTTLNRKAGTDRTGRLEPTPSPALEDECPGVLVSLVGAPPCFAAPVRPTKHVVEYPDGLSLTYSDNVRVRQKYAYYRFPEGVNSEGVSVRKLSGTVLDRLCRAAGISTKEQRVMKAVSLLEGGFDSINTYDTGFVSVGFIQFACLSEGSGSLGKMLSLYKSTNPKAFDSDFRKFGIDVDTNRLVALDIETGKESRGADAARLVIRDKRLVSVFQRAGLISDSFRVAQLRAAKAQFYPGDDEVDVNLNGKEVTIRLDQIFRSEAGLATLMDRKVNTGKIAGLKESIERAADEFGIDSPKDLHLLEFVLAQSLSYRTDYISTTALAKPRDNRIELSRRGSRFGRTKGQSGPTSGGTSRKGSRSKRN